MEQWMQLHGVVTLPIKKTEYRVTKEINENWVQRTIRANQKDAIRSLLLLWDLLPASRYHPEPQLRIQRKKFYVLMHWTGLALTPRIGKSAPRVHCWARKRAILILVVVASILDFPAKEKSISSKHLDNLRTILRTGLPAQRISCLSPQMLRKAQPTLSSTGTWWRTRNAFWVLVTKRLAGLKASLMTTTPVNWSRQAWK